MDHAAERNICNIIILVQYIDTHWRKIFDRFYVFEIISVIIPCMLGEE